MQLVANLESFIPQTSSTEHKHHNCEHFWVTANAQNAFHQPSYTLST